MKTTLAALAALLALAALTACAAEPQPASSGSLPPQPSATAPGSAEPGSETGSAPQPAGENTVETKGVGESISGCKRFTIRYEDGTQSAIERGVEGLTYTLEGVKVYDSIESAGVDMYGCTAEGEELLARPFVLAELRADYAALAGGQTEVIADANDLTPMMRTDELEGDTLPAFPALGYFSLRPKEDDAKLDSRHQAYCYIIKDGESVTFQLGIFCDRALLDAKDLYLEVNAVPAPPDGGVVEGDTVKRMFDLLGE